MAKGAFPWRDFFRRIVPPLVVWGLVGWWIGHKVVAIPHLRVDKLLTLIAVFFDIGGVVLLSQFVAGNERYRRFVANTLSDQFSGLFGGIIVGLFLFYQFGHDGPSKGTLGEMWNGIILCSLALSMFMSTIFSENKGTLSEATRANILGGLFLGLGLLLHLASAFLDLYS
jgi:hypothetical protein